MTGPTEGMQVATIEFTPENQRYYDFWMAGDGTLTATPKGRVIDCDACGEFYHEDYIGACNDDGMAYCEDCHVGCPCLEDY